MTLWAKNMAIASTWELKHQIAFWKSKAKALEYENKVLHDIIRKNNLITDPIEQVTSSLERFSCSSDEDDEESPDSEETSDSEESEEDSDAGYKPSKEVNSDAGYEPSKEFIDFLIQNEKYKEEARLEKERLNKEFNKEENDKLSRMEAPPEENEDDSYYKEMYGEGWERICALETALKCKWITETEKELATYWPNIPLNL